ncbi:MAG TPA: sigma-70 family RNA polymerase sigma factor [Bryobacteraceae bacterium]|nr:sigma-70 family RNA polymerase sigma factor [Bryobacteraceae bacterium]HPT27683.1 sigma-70 family RNA polymerase sigma factor [Bryobacteraceae bacterium]
MQQCRHIDEEALSGDPAYRVDPEAEAQLVERLRAGEESAYELLLAHFQQPVYSLVQRLIDDASEASDVTQDVFLKVFRNIGSFRGQSSLKTWVYRISVNEAHNRRRWFGRHRRAEIELESDDTGKSWLEHLSDQSRTPYELVLNQERRAAIERALAGLSPAFRDAVVLRDLEDLSYEEIADVLDVSIGTVKSRILRGRDALRKALLDELEPARGMQFEPQTVE